jgi:hypothetical protein
MKPRRGAGARRPDMYDYDEIPYDSDSEMAADEAAAADRADMDNDSNYGEWA